MKKLFLVLGLLCLAAVIGIAIFLATFDIDRYRPVLISTLEDALKRPVSLGRISLKWDGGFALDLQQLAIHEQGQAGASEPLLQVDSASALVRLLPLFRKEVQISSILLKRPTVHVSRDAQGRVNLVGLVAAASPGAASAYTAPAASSAPVAVNIATVQMVGGAVHWTDATTSPPMDLWLRQADVRVKNIAPGRPMDFDLRGALLAETPNLLVSGRLTPPGPNSQGSVEQIVFTAEDIPLQQVLPPVPQGSPELRGRLTLRLQGTLGTLDAAQALSSLTGGGSLRVANPVIANLNILRAVFERFAMLPGLVEILESRLPAHGQEALQAKNTEFAPIDLSMEIQGGKLLFKDLNLRTEIFSIAGEGQLGLDRSLTALGTLAIEPSLSAAIVRSVKELSALVNERGVMEFPLTLQGQVPQVSVRPDLNYIASRVLSAKAGDLLGSVLKRLGPQEEPSSQAPEGPPAPGDEPPANPFADFLNRALQPAPSNATPSQSQ